MNELTTKSTISWLSSLANTYQEKKDYLIDLDREIGDADHGFNMARGFNAVAEKIASLEGSDIGTVLKTTAMTLISTVGGASGPLYGSFFLQASTVGKDKTSLNVDEVGELLEAGFKSVQQRGKATVGEKTMIDAMEPAVNAFMAAKGEGLAVAADKAREAARAGAESTIPIQATKGRASYLGERSIGHKDPGSESTALLFDEFYKAVSA